MLKRSVAVLRGGPSLEYDMSLISGQAVIDAIDESKYSIVDIFVDKEAAWYHKGLPTNPADILSKVDMVFNCLHGTYGEDGQVQNILEASAVPFTGPKAFEAAISFHKALSLQELSKAKIENLKIQGQFFINSISLVDKGALELSDEVFQKMAPPYILKPVKSGSSFGVVLVNTRDELANAIEKLVLEFEEIVVEEFILGTELTVSAVEQMRGEDIYVAPALEILKKDKKIFDAEAKYLEASEETVRMPAQISSELKDKLTQVSKDIFRRLGARHYARIDFIVARDKDIYFLELNALPGLGPNSLLPKTLEAVGIDFPQFVEHIINITLEN